MVEMTIKINTRLYQFPLELAERLLQFLLDINTPVPFLTTVLSSAGGRITVANLVTVEPTRTSIYQF
jgi:hypothetical protein